MKKPIPSFANDEAAQAFVDTADLAEYDFSGGLPVRLALPQRSVPLDVDVPQSLLDAVKARAEADGVPYARYVEQVLEKAVAPVS